MKTVKYIYISLISFAIFGLWSCEIAEDLDSYEPLYSLEAETAIVDEATADLALIGVYAGFRQQSTKTGIPEVYLIPSMMSGTMTNQFFFNNGAESVGYSNNNPLASGTTSNLNGYTRLYGVINRANWLLEQVLEVEEDKFVTPDRKSEIIAEAKCLRALANFYLLRLWGQFYDVDSQYGIVLRSDPARSDEAFPRSTVLESYDAIIADLDDAIANAPDMRAKFYVSKTFAKGLKAKVLLYQGEYDEAASLAQEVINNAYPTIYLAPTYGSIFLDHSSPALFDSPEVLFGTRGTSQEGTGMGNFTGFWVSLTGDYVGFGFGSTTVGSQNITYDNNRISSVVFPDNIFGFPDTAKYDQGIPGQGYEMVYHLRMAEVYLIYAEAAARSVGTVTSDALDALNAVRLRAGATTTGGDGFEIYPATINLNQFIEAVRIEKYVELGAESGEEWFDLVRYHFEDGFDVSTVKPSATNSDKYILPIDANNIEVGGGVVVQNPSY